MHSSVCRSSCLRKLDLDHLLCTDEQHDVEGAEPQPQADAPAPQHTWEAAPAGAEAANAQPDVVPPATAAEAAAPPAADVPDDEWAEQTGRRPISAFEKVANATLMLAESKPPAGTMFCSILLRFIHGLSKSCGLLLRLQFSPGPLLCSYGNCHLLTALCRRQRPATATGSGSRATGIKLQWLMPMLRRWAASAREPPGASRCNSLQYI